MVLCAACLRTRVLCDNPTEEPCITPSLTKICTINRTLDSATDSLYLEVRPLRRAG